VQPLDQPRSVRNRHLAVGLKQPGWHQPLGQLTGVAADFKRAVLAVLALEVADRSLVITRGAFIARLALGVMQRDEFLLGGRGRVTQPRLARGIALAGWLQVAKNQPLTGSLHRAAPLDKRLRNNTTDGGVQPCAR